MGKRVLKIIRTWLRDGSTNEMDLEAAVGNLHQNGHAETSAREIEEDFLSGAVIGTAHATFRLKD